MNASADDWARVDRALRTYLRAQGLSAPDADDVLQMALERVLKGLDRLRSPAAFDAFVMQTTRNARADFFRRAPKDRPGAEPLAEPCGPPAPSDAEAEGASAQRLLGVWLRAELERLPEPTRSTLRRTELEGWDYRAVAEADGVSVSAVKSRVSRGRQELKRRLQRCCAVELDARRRVTGYQVRACPRCGGDVNGSER